MPAASGLPWLPIDWGPPALRDPLQARTFLEVLWQVEAGALALSLTIIVFSLELIRREDRAGGLTIELAVAAKIFPAFYAGISAIAVSGLVLLGYGRQAPTDWAALAAAINATAALGSVGVVFAYGLRLLDAARRRAVRIRVLEESVARGVDDEVRAALGDEYLKRRFGESVELTRWLASPRPQYFAAYVKTAGRVADVRLAALRRRVATSSSRPALVLLGCLETYFGGNHECAQLAPDISERLRRNASRIFRIKQQRDDVATGAVDRLHDEAIAAIRAGEVSGFDLVADAYVDAAEALPKAWERYARSTGGASQMPRMHPFQFPISDRISTHVYEEVIEALRQGPRDLAIDIVYVPIRLALAVSARGALQDARGYLDLMSAIYETTFDVDAPWRDLVRGRTHQNLRSYGHLAVSRQRGISPSAEATARLRDELLVLSRSIGELLHRIISREDLETLPQAQRSAREAFEFLSLEARWAGLADQVEEWQRTQRFGLAMWSLRHLLRDKTRTRAEVWLFFQRSFGSFEEIIAATSDAFAQWRADVTPWPRWLMEDDESGQVRVLDTERHIVRTFLVLTMMAPQLGEVSAPQQWFEGHREQLLAEVDALAADRELWALLPTPEDLDERARRLRQLIEAGAVAYESHEAERIRAAALDDGRTAELRNGVAAGYAEHALLAPMFEEFGTVGTSEECREAAPWRGFSLWVSKEMFVEAGRMGGISHFGEGLGRELADAEMNELVLGLGVVSPLVDGDAPPTQQLGRALDELRTARFTPSIVLVPVSWRLSRALGLEPIYERGDDEAWSATSNRAFRGFAHGLPVWSWHTLRRSMYVVDLASFGCVCPVHAKSNGPRVDITTYTEAEALELCTDRPELMRGDGADSVEDRAARLQLQALVRVESRLRVHVRSNLAVRQVRVEAESVE